jgi:type VI secretion system secreted protein VgrG
MRLMKEVAMAKPKHNKPHFELHFSELAEDTVHVLAFEGEESISRLFHYRIELLSYEPELNPADILNKKATFILNRGDEDPVKIHGIISHFEQRGRTPRYISYYAELVPRMWRLGLTYANEVFQKMNVEKIITQVLRNSGFSGRDFKYDLRESYPELEYSVQYRETNFDLVNRRLEHFGIFYYFDHRSENDVIVFTDSNDTLPSIEQTEDIPYNPNNDPLSQQETISEVSFQAKVVTGLVRLKNYNYRFPERDLTVESQIDPDAPGLYYEYGDHYQETREGEFLAKVRNEEILSHSKIFKGRSDCRLFQAGSRFKMGKHYRDDWNGNELILTRVVSCGTQRGLFAILPEAKEVLPTFENVFEAIPMDIKYRPPRITAVPKISGIMTARTESGAGDEYAFVDDQGRYKVKLPFDLSDKTNGEASRPIRLTQPYSGPGYGTHFPNHADAEMIFSCINGDMDRPIGLGTIPNPSQASPVSRDNRHQGVIRTAAGNEIVLDDKTGESQIGITTTDAHKVLLDDKDDKIDIVTTNKHKITFDDKNKNITVQTTDGHLLIMDDQNTKITVQSKNGHRLCIDDSNGSESITVADKDDANVFIIDITNNKLVIKTNDGSIDIHAPNGTIDIQATELNIETSADTSLKAANVSCEAQGNYELKAGGDITEECANYDLKADMGISAKANTDLKMKGMNVEVKADMNTKIGAGMNLEAKGGMQAKLDGMMTDVSGSAMTKIKGGVVMIN